jgi:DNA-binding NarL/FixJ family response regulator
MTTALAPPLRVVLVDDSGLFRRGLRLLLDSVGISVVADLPDASAVEAAVEANRPDAVVLDVRLPPGFTDEGLRAAGHLRDAYPQLGILVFSTYAEPRLVTQLLDRVPSGVGYLLKDRVDDVDELVTALRRVSNGGVAVDGQVVADLLRRNRRDSPVDRLSARELSVLSALAEGRSNVGIANGLHLSVKTVETHIASIFRELDLGDEAESNRRVRAALAYLAAQG